MALSANKIQNNKTNYTLGGRYTFGAFAVATSFNEVRNVLSSDFSAFAADYRRRGVSLGGSANFGAATVTLDVTRDLKHEFAGGKLKKYTNGLVEVKYALSKRTFVYGDYLRLDGTNNYGLGLRHNF